MTNHRPPPAPGVVITAECEHCGRIRITPAALTITVSGETTTYAYTCPLCGTPRTRPATPDVLLTLTRAHRRDHYLTHTPTPHTEAPRG